MVTTDRIRHTIPSSLIRINIKSKKFLYQIILILRTSSYKTIETKYIFFYFQLILHWFIIDFSISITDLLCCLIHAVKVAFMSREDFILHAVFAVRVTTNASKCYFLISAFINRPLLCSCHIWTSKVKREIRSKTHARCTFQIWQKFFKS